MNLLLPTPTVTLGPLYAFENNAAFTTIDSHNHTPGFGAPIPAAALLINEDLSIQGFNLTTSRSLRLQIQGSPLSQPTDLASIYSVGGELFYNDGVGNQVQITLGGAIDVSSSGNISGMGATTASVAYTNGNKTFTFNQNTNQRAILDVGTVIIRDPGSAGVNGISIKSPTGLAASYNLTLPTALSASTTFLMSDSSGQLSYYTGNTVAVSNTNAASSLAIVRGSFYYNGSSMVISGGEGFSVTRTLAGNYNVTFSSVFADAPIVTFAGTNTGASPYVLSLLSSTPPTTSGFKVLAYTTTSSSTLVEVSASPGINFIAIGLKA